MGDPSLRGIAGHLGGEVSVELSAHERAHQAADRFRLAIEAAPTGMIMVDDQGRIELVNAQVERLFGYPREELIGKPLEMLVPERFRGGHPAFRAAFSSDPESRPIGQGRELYGLRRNGTEVPIEIGLNPLRTPDGILVGSFVGSIVDISERKRAEQEREQLLRELWTLNAELERRVEARTSELSLALKEREVLLQEVHHRVKNNLQVISSLISMQLRSLATGMSRGALEECQTRVQAIALIHEKLYPSSDYARVPFSEYVESLAGNVFRGTGLAPEGVALELAMEDMALAVDKAIPCGLVLNELITNALKHAFPHGRKGTIRVALSPGEAGGLQLVVADDGVGLPSGLDVDQSPTLGLQLVRMLTRQLGARLEVDATRGTTFRLTVPAEK